MTRQDGGFVLEALEKIVKPNRSSKYLLSRHGVIHRRGLEAALKRAGAGARRGRLLRLLGRKDEARAAFHAALKDDPADPRAQAWLWELEFGRGEEERPFPFDGLARA